MCVKLCDKFRQDMETFDKIDIINFLSSIV